MSEEKQQTFLMGGVEVEFKPMRGIGPLGRWKDAHLQTVVDTVFGLEDVDWQVKLVDDEGKMGDIGSILGQIRPVIDKALNVPNLILDATLDWLEPDKELKKHLEEEVPIEDFMPPLRWMVGQIFPLEQLTGMFGTPAGTGKRSSSPKANGGGKKPKRKRGK